MPKIKFKATPGFACYHDFPDFQDGDIREVDESRYRKLLKDFPDNFISVEEEKNFPEDILSIGEEKKIENKSNKAILGKKNK
jgi:hypothetical protein